MIRDVHIYFHKLDKIAHVFINEKLKDSELSRGLFFYVLELSHQDGLSLHDLSRAIFIDKAYTTRAVARLTELGYVTRQADEADRRLIRIYLTAKGHEAAKMINDIFVEWRDLISGGVSQAESAAVLEISRKLYDNAFRYYSELEE